MPQQAWSKKRERQYEHVKSGLEERGPQRGDRRGDRSAHGQQGTGPRRRVRPGQSDLDRGHILRSSRREALPQRRAGADQGPALQRGEGPWNRGTVEDDDGGAPEGGRSLSGPGSTPRGGRRRQRGQAGAAHPQLQRAAPGAPGHPDRRADPHRLPADDPVHPAVHRAGHRAGQRLPGRACRRGAGDRAGSSRRWPSTGRCSGRGREGGWLVHAANWSARGEAWPLLALTMFGRRLPGLRRRDQPDAQHRRRVDRPGVLHAAVGCVPAGEAHQRLSP